MPKSELENLKIKNKRRKSIIISATSIFAFISYKNVSIDTITKSANCSHGLFYHYFKSKEDIFNAVMEEAIESISLVIDRINLNQYGELTALDKLITSFLNILKGNNNYMVSVLYLLLNLRLQKDEIPKPKVQKQCKKPLNVVIFSLIEEAQKKGECIQGNPKEYTIAIIALLKGLTYNRLYVGSKRFLCPTSQTIMNIFTNYEGNN